MSLIRSNQLEYRQAGESDFDFLWELHRSELHPYIKRIWSWDEGWQESHFRSKFDPANQQIILYDGQDIGTVKVEEQKYTIFLAYIVISSEYQGRGLGTAVIQDVICLGERKGHPVSLKVLRGNPARGLYERLGFQVTEVSETHIWMKKIPPCTGVRYH